MSESSGSTDIVQDEYPVDDGWQPSFFAEDDSFFEDDQAASALALVEMRFSHDGDHTPYFTPDEEKVAYLTGYDRRHEEVPPEDYVLRAVFRATRGSDPTEMTPYEQHRYLDAKSAAAKKSVEGVITGLQKKIDEEQPRLIALTHLRLEPSVPDEVAEREVDEFADAIESGEGPLFEAWALLKNGMLREARTKDQRAHIQQYIDDTFASRSTHHLRKLLDLTDANASARAKHFRRRQQDFKHFLVESKAA